MSAPARNDSKPPRQNPTVATPGRAGALAQRGDRGGGVLLDARDRQLLDVGHVLELLVARAEAGGAAEVVDRDRVVAGLREPLGELGVERVQAADVGQDHDPARRGPTAPRASAAEKCVPSADVSSSSSAPAPPAIGASSRSSGGAGGRASKSKHMRARQNTGMTEATISATDPATFRAQFPVLERLSYLNAGTEGPIPRAAAEAVRAGSTSRSTRAAAGARTSRG